MRLFLHHAGSLYGHTSCFLCINNRNNALVFKRDWKFFVLEFQGVGLGVVVVVVVGGGGVLDRAVQGWTSSLPVTLRGQFLSCRKEGGVETFSELEVWWVRNGHYSPHTALPATFSHR